MKEPNQDKQAKICPLLNMNPENIDIDCMGRLCAWFIPHRPPAEGGCCAIVCMAGR